MEEAQDVLWGRCGAGDTMGRVGRNEVKAEEWELGGALGVFGLGRPGGGPEEEAMPGAKAQQAERGICVCGDEGNHKRMWRGERAHTEREGGDGSKSQRSDALFVSS